MSTSDLSSLPGTGGRPWWTFLAVAMLVSIALRVALPSGIAVEHFDEGVYASNLWCPDTDFRYPDRHLYAPPLLPALIELLLLVLGPGQIVPSLVCLVAGISLVPLLGEMSRRWLGEPAARAIVTLAVFSDLHILYSRTGLTDVLWTTWLVAALWLIHAALRRSRPLLVIAAGIAVGLGWWTKYTGWLPLAISLAGIGGALVLGTAGGVQARRWLRGLLLISIVAGMTIAPHFIALADDGGYSAVVENHGRYLVGLGGWISTLTTQADNHIHLESGLGALGLVLAVWLAAGRPWRFTWNAGTRPLPRRQLLILSFSVAGIGAIFSVALVLGLLATLALVLRFRLRAVLDERMADVDPEHSGNLAGWMLAVWWIGLTLVTPLYYPYPRLTLPWLVASWMVAGALIGRIAWLRVANESGREPRPVRAASGLVVIACLLLGLGLVFRVQTYGFSAWQPRTSMIDVADGVLIRINAAEPSGLKVIRVWGEPAVFYQLNARAGDDIQVQPAGGLSVIPPGDPSPDFPVFVLVGPHVLNAKEPFHVDRARFEPLGPPIRVSPSRLVQRNQPPARQDQPMEFRLFRFRPSPPAS